jgi:hypothetical protein
LGTHEGESTVMRKAFDRKRSRISMLELEAVPQSCVPYVQIGLSIVLVISMQNATLTKGHLAIDPGDVTKV